MNYKLGSVFSICLVLMMNSVSVLGRFVVEKNSLRVTSPDSIKDTYECAIGNFGVPQYGGTLVGTVQYPKADQKACVDIKKIDACIRDPDADVENPVLKEEQDAQIGKGSRGDVTILPTLVINDRQDRGGSQCIYLRFRHHFHAGLPLPIQSGRKGNEETEELERVDGGKREISKNTAYMVMPESYVLQLLCVQKVPKEGTSEHEPLSQ